MTIATHRNPLWPIGDPLASARAQSRKRRAGHDTGASMPNMKLIETIAVASRRIPCCPGLHASPAPGRDAGPMRGPSSALTTVSRWRYRRRWRRWQQHRQRRHPRLVQRRQQRRRPRPLHIRPWLHTGPGRATEGPANPGQHDPRGRGTQMRGTQYGAAYATQMNDIERSYGRHGAILRFAASTTAMLRAA